MEAPLSVLPVTLGGGNGAIGLGVRLTVCPRSNMGPLQPGALVGASGHKQGVFRK